MTTDLAPDLLLSKIFSITEKRVNESNKITNKKKKMNYVNAAFGEAIDEYVLEIAKMSDKEYGKLIRKRGNQISIITKKFQDQLLGMMRDDKNIDMETLSSVAQSFDTKSFKLSPKTDKILVRKKILERLFALEFLGKIELFTSLVLLMLELNSLSKLENIIKSRFDSDMNWAFAVSILATHENLVKKKLIDLGMSEDEIKDFLNNKGNHFPNLVDHLSKLIMEKENRSVGLSFYRSSALRAIRNKLEHEGYKQKITKQEIVDLLNDIEKFDHEIFPIKQPQ